MSRGLRYHFYFALAGLLLTFLISVGDNPLNTTILRSLYCFAAFLVLSFAARWLFGKLLTVSPEPHEVPGTTAASSQPQDDKGQHVDLVTPEDGEQNGSLQNSGDDIPPADFKPLQLPKLATTDNLDPDELAKALRHLKDN